MTRSPRRVVLLTALVTAVGPLPSFAVAANAGYIREELSLTPSQLGVVLAAFGITSTVGVWRFGAIVEHWGARRTLMWSCSVSALVLLGIAAVANDFLVLGLLLLLAGLANALSQPAGNLATAFAVGLGGQGLAFGAKQAAIPLCSILVGVMVPLVSVTLGWRTSFVVMCLIAVAAAVWSSRLSSVPVPRHNRAEGRWRPTRFVVLAACVGFLAATSGNSLTSFFVDSLVVRGFDDGVAAAMLVAGGVCAVLGRLGLGRLADLSAVSPHVIAGAAMALGAVGFVVLAVIEGPVALGLATVMVFGFGWAWPGLLLATAVRSDGFPARSSARVQTGTFAGGVVGPAGFGLVAEVWSYSWGWMACAVVLLAAAAVLVVGTGHVT